MTNQDNPKRSRQGGARLARREKKPSRMTPAEKKKVALLVVGTILAVLLCVLLIYRQWAKAPDLPGDDLLGVGDPAELDGTKPYLTGDRKKDFYTFLIIGRDTGGGGNTDTLMLAAYDVANQQVSLMSIPRDTMVNVSWDVKKINSVYNMYANKGEEASVEALEEAVADLVGFRADYTVIMEWDAVGEIVDAVGGVWFEIPFNMYYRDSFQDLFINQPKGYRLLNGSDAMEVVRWRKNNSGVSTGDPSTDGSDLARTKVQQDFIAAVLRQCLQIQNVTKINQIADAFTKNVKTELTIGNLVWFAEQALTGGFSTDNMYTCTMPNIPKTAYSRSYNAYLSYVVPNAEELIDIVNQYFNPYQQEVTLSNLELMSINSDGSLSCSSGVVKDSKATRPVAEQAPADQPVETTPVDESELHPVETEEPVDDPDVEPTETVTPPVEETPAVQETPPAESREPVDQPSEQIPEQPSEPVPEPVTSTDPDPEQNNSEGAVSAEDGTP